MVSPNTATLISIQRPTWRSIGRQPSQIAVIALLATAALLLRGGEVVGPNLSLLGHYLYGFDASWRGAAMGTAEAGVGGFALGFLLGRSINWLVDRHEMGIRRGLEYASAVDPFGAVDQ